MYLCIIMAMMTSQVRALFVGCYGGSLVRRFETGKLSFGSSSRRSSLLLSTKSTASNDLSPSREGDPTGIREKWLVVGDGDLSFCAYLSQNLPDNVDLIASVLEEEPIHNNIYRDSKLHCSTIAEHHRVLFGLDATLLHERFEPQSLHRIVFNFPHWRGKANNRQNRALLDSFFRSSAQVLHKEQGSVRVALLPSQGGSQSKDHRDWKMSWKAAELAAENGLLLKSCRPFRVEYTLSSYRGADRSFAAPNALEYVFAYANGHPVDESIQLACRHELRLELDPKTQWKYSVDELTKGGKVLEYTSTLVPPGIRAHIPAWAIVQRKTSPIPLLVLLMVYSGEATALSRQLADSIRANLESSCVDAFGLQVTKRDRLVSFPFPLKILDSLIEDRD